MTPARARRERRAPVVECEEAAAPQAFEFSERPALLFALRLRSEARLLERDAAARRCRRCRLAEQRADVGDVHPRALSPHDIEGGLLEDNLRRVAAHERHVFLEPHASRQALRLVVPPTRQLDAVRPALEEVCQASGRTAEAAAQIEDSARRCHAGATRERDDGRQAADMVLIGDVRQGVVRQVEFGDPLERPARAGDTREDRVLAQRMVGVKVLELV